MISSRPNHSRYRLAWNHQQGLSQCDSDSLFNLKRLKNIPLIVKREISIARRKPRSEIQPPACHLCPDGIVRQIAPRFDHGRRRRLHYNTPACICQAVPVQQQVDLRPYCSGHHNDIAASSQVFLQAAAVCSETGQINCMKLVLRNMQWKHLMKLSQLDVICQLFENTLHQRLCSLIRFSVSNPQISVDFPSVDLQFFWITCHIHRSSAVIKNNFCSKKGLPAAELQC